MTILRRVFNRAPAAEKSVRWYPEKISAGNMGGEFASAAVDLLLETQGSKARDRVGIAEFGIWRGATSLKFAEFLANQGQLDLFDFEDRVTAVARELKARGFDNVHAHGSSYKHVDSYNWSLKRVLERHTQPIWDFIYLDGAHTWAIDALTFFLADILLKVGGVIVFDDCGWTLRNSSLDPRRIPAIGEQYTDEQIDAQQVRLIIELLVRRNPHYREIAKNYAFLKLA
jgi:predicted O-methyltransferase YrrM